MSITNEEILANAPEGATHILIDYEFHVTFAKRRSESSGWFWLHPDIGWLEFDRMPTMQNIYCLSDIRRIVELEQKLEAAERERDELIVFSQHLIDCHKNGIQCLVDIDYSEFAGKFAIEQQIKAVEYCYKNIPDLADSDYVKLKRRAEQLRQQLNGGE